MKNGIYRILNLAIISVLAVLSFNSCSDNETIIVDKYKTNPMPEIEVVECSDNLSIPKVEKNVNFVYNFSIMRVYTDNFINDGNFSFLYEIPDDMKGCPIDKLKISNAAATEQRPLNTIFFSDFGLSYSVDADKAVNSRGKESIKVNICLTTDKTIYDITDVGLKIDLNGLWLYVSFMKDPHPQGQS